jgi:hypothetical protein
MYPKPKDPTTTTTTTPPQKNIKNTGSVGRFRIFVKRQRP